MKDDLWARVRGFRRLLYLVLLFLDKLFPDCNTT